MGKEKTAKIVKVKGKKSADQKGGISIRTQLYIGFLLPVIFIIVVGIVSYRNASAGLVENYEESARNAWR